MSWMQYGLQRWQWGLTSYFDDEKADGEGGKVRNGPDLVSTPDYIVDDACAIIGSIEDGNRNRASPQAFPKALDPINVRDMLKTERAFERSRMPSLSIGVENQLHVRPFHESRFQIESSIKARNCVSL